jgi:GAF domain-containing protein
MTFTALSNNLSPEHLAALYDIIRLMNSSLEFDQALANVSDAVMQITRAERGVLMGYDSGSGELTLLAARGLHGETLTQDEAYSTTIVQQVIETREPLLTNNAMFDDRIKPGQSIIMRGLRAILCAPMLVQDRLLGVVYVDTAMKTGNFSAADRDLLSAVASQAGIALENARCTRSRSRRAGWSVNFRWRGRYRKACCRAPCRRCRVMMWRRCGNPPAKWRGTFTMSFN